MMIIMVMMIRLMKKKRHIKKLVFWLCLICNNKWKDKGSAENCCSDNLKREKEE